MPLLKQMINRTINDENRNLLLNNLFITYMVKRPGYICVCVCATKRMKEPSFEYINYSSANFFNCKVKS